MARYDRIARIEPPGRDNAYLGWLALRDLEEDERNTDLGRRARLRFMTARLVHRLVRRGADIDADSFQRQCDAVREELGQLPGRDAERQRLADFLKQAPGLDMGAVAAAALDLGDGALEDGHPFAAEEFFRAGTELADRHGLDDVRSRGERALAALRH
jgi:hypothetical protein